MAHFDGYVIELTKNEFRNVEKVCQANSWNYFSDNIDDWDTYNQDHHAASKNANKFMTGAQRVIDYINETGIKDDIDTEFGFDVIVWINANKVQRNDVKDW